MEYINKSNSSLAFPLFQPRLPQGEGRGGEGRRRGGRGGGSEAREERECCHWFVDVPQSFEGEREALHPSSSLLNRNCNLLPVPSNLVLGVSVMFLQSWKDMGKGEGGGNRGGRYREEGAVAE